jgi:glutamine synthetase
LELLDIRQTPVRVTYTPSNSSIRPKEYRFEVRTFDGTANPYLGLAAIITAGFHGGIQKKLPLTLKELKGKNKTFPFPTSK